MGLLLRLCSGQRESVSDLEAMIANAKTIYDNDAVTQEDVDAMVEQLKASIASVEYKDADYNVVYDAIDAANAIEEGMVKDYSAVLAALNAVEFGKDIREQANVDAMAQAIYDAMEQLEYLPADYTAVNAAIEAANQLNPDDYVDFVPVLDAIYAVVEGKDIREQASVNAMAKAINDAVNSLVKKADKSALAAKLAEVSNVKGDDYTAESYAEFETALKAANDVMNDATATQEAVNQALKNLNDAYDLLAMKDTTGPEDPAEFNVIPGTNSVTFEWSASASDDVEYYELVSLPSYELIKRMTGTSFVWENLESGISGSVMLYTYDKAGNRSFGIQAPYITFPELTAPTKVENVKAADTDYKTITLTWDASEGATAYEVYRKAYDSEEFKLYKTVEDTTVAVSGVMTGKEYAFYVVAKNEAGVAQASETVTQATTLHGKVTLAIEKVSTAKFKLSWNAIDGATRYIVYRKRNDDKMKKVLTLGAKDLEYTTAELPHGDYQFILKAGRYDSKDRVMTGSSNTVKVSVEELAPTVKLTSGSKSVKVAWSKMECVTHYQVYRATSKTGKYTKLTTTTSTSYTLKNLTKGKEYFFKVRGYKNYKSGDDIAYNVYTDYSSIKSAKAK